MIMNMTNRKKTYLENKNKNVGEICICPICYQKFVKKNYQQVFCCNECKVKFHNDKQRGKRNNYFRRYNKKHPERYTRVGIDLDFEKWKSEYYRDSSCFGEIPSVTISEDELERQYFQID